MDPIEKVEKIEQDMMAMAKDIHEIVAKYQAKTKAKINTINIEWDGDKITDVYVTL